MTPEVRAYLDKAAEDLADARKIHAISLYKVAARCAYYVAFHAAEALLLARTGRIAKTHRGVRSGLSYDIRLIPSGWRMSTSLKRRAGWLIRLAL